ncbi:T9SS type A sorting domain-containing protein [Hymenobacter sp.]|uniref:T9SS type A sorting domain-containing protein n=1 Tax=Hymenobacter sp. TaxID=1898978 RepID=UPI00286A0D44|nr:T9SS type A sorting domain-containing protein [Hymenobacter sp.]
MEIVLRFLLAAVAGTSLLGAAQAQTFSNSTLDTWATRTTAVSTGVDAPTNWLTTDDLLAEEIGQRLPFSTGTVTKAPTARTGPFAAQLQTQSLGGEVIPGILLLGASYNNGNGGTPFTGRPANLQFYYQLSGARAVADSAAAVVQFTRRVGGASVVVAEALYFFPALATTYTLATVPLTYTSGLAPDSLFLAFVSGSVENSTAGTTLTVDDIAFTGTVTATRDAALAAAIGVAPNPSPDGRYTISAAEPTLLAASLVVLDATGRVVRREEAPPRAAATRALDLSGLPAGLYTVQLFTPRGVVTRKLSR